MLQVVLTCRVGIINESKVTFNLTIINHKSPRWRITESKVTFNLTIINLKSPRWRITESKVPFNLTIINHKRPRWRITAKPCQLLCLVLTACDKMQGAHLYISDFTSSKNVVVMKLPWFSLMMMFWLQINITRNDI